MHHRVGPDGRDRLVDGVAVADVEVAVAEGHDPVAGRLAVQGEVVAQLAAGPGDEDLHEARSFSGRHHHSLARYQATVASRASSSVRCLAHPRALTLAMSTEYRRSWPSRSVT